MASACWVDAAGRAGCHAAAGASRVPDDDLFAPEPSTETDRARIHELEAAGRDAAETLSHAADAIRAALAEQETR